MATYNKFDNGTKHVIDGKISFSTDTFKVMLTNTAPVVTNNLYGDISASELANGAGYSTGGATLAVTTSTSGSNPGIAKATVSADITFTATASMGPFRYIVVYDFTTASPLKPLWCFFDYGSSVTLANTETFTLDFDQSAGLFTAT